MKKTRGVVGMSSLVGLVILAVTLPFLNKLIKKPQDTRNFAVDLKQCTDKDGNKINSGIKYCTGGKGYATCKDGSPVDTKTCEGAMDCFPKESDDDSFVGIHCDCNLGVGGTLAWLQKKCNSDNSAYIECGRTLSETKCATGDKCKDGYCAPATGGDEACAPGVSVGQKYCSSKPGEVTADGGKQWKQCKVKDGKLVVDLRGTCPFESLCYSGICNCEKGTVISGSRYCTDAKTWKRCGFSEGGVCPSVVKDGKTVDGTCKDGVCNGGSTDPVTCEDKSGETVGKGQSYCVPGTEGNFETCGSGLTGNKCVDPKPICKFDGYGASCVGYSCKDVSGALVGNNKKYCLDNKTIATCENGKAKPEGGDVCLDSKPDCLFDITSGEAECGCFDKDKKFISGTKEAKYCVDDMNWKTCGAKETDTNKGDCKTGEKCVGGECVSCGMEVSKACCSDDTCKKDGLRCNITKSPKVCEECGKLGQMCCIKDKVESCGDDKLECVKSVCVAKAAEKDCGKDGQKCCSPEAGKKPCEVTGSTCDADTNICRGAKKEGEKQWNVCFKPTTEKTCNLSSGFYKDAAICSTAYGGRTCYLDDKGVEKGKCDTECKASAKDYYFCNKSAYTCDLTKSLWLDIEKCKAVKGNCYEKKDGDTGCSKDCVNEKASTCKKNLTPEKKDYTSGPDIKGGDFNCDGVVNVADYSVWRKESVDHAKWKHDIWWTDSNGSGGVDADDDGYSRWRDAWLR